MALYETERPKTKTELYKEKLKERELYSNNFLDRFTENGAGAPLRNIDGTIMTKRRNMLSNYDDTYQAQRNATPNPLSLNNNNSDYNLNNNTQFYNQQTNNNLNNTIGFQRENNLMNDFGFNDNINNNNYQNINLYQTLNNNTNNLNNNDIYNGNYNNQNENTHPDFSSSFHRRPQSQTVLNNLYNNNINSQNNNIDDNNDPFGNNYKGTGIIPRDRNISDEDKKNQNKLLRDTWLQEMEEKKAREAKQKQEQIELDLKDEMSYQKERKN